MNNLNPKIGGNRVAVDCVDSIVSKEKVIKWRDGNIYFLLGIVAVYFSISFSSRVVDCVDGYYFDNDYKKTKKSASMCR
ncbi:MAG: hypothetical protein C4617_01955 [Candidatus Liberibacter europaeus]|uniref:Uncharacterized protein n=1 Tax=Candidatus Liberibacter europaeus TaxID=744859 RepID=A0A2T4VXV4_9HYPH|nr:hypothetical protein [Candidatus Liberibacter europaeus]PTL86606.1 MAG: hypothetical protein C4617_01955 [Candidatus Liberibacter europaeus]